jgi:hypothetical protein
MEVWGYFGRNYHGDHLNPKSGDNFKLFVKDKSDGFEWILVEVYGAAQDALQPDFLAE